MGNFQSNRASPKAILIRPRRYDVTVIVHAKALRSTALMAALSAGLTLVMGFSALAANAPAKHHKIPLPKSRPAARHVVPTTAAARATASPSLPAPVAAPAPPARQRVTTPTPARKPVTPAAVAALRASGK